MRVLIVLSGDVRSDSGALAWLDRCDRVVCADGGARHLRRLGRLPDLLVGDLDSAQPDDVAWMTRQGVELHQYPVAKDATDSELAVLAALEFLDNQADRSAQELVLLGAFGSRPDHVLANQLLAADLAGQGWRLVLTDGISCLYTLVGGQTLHIAHQAPPGKNGQPAPDSQGPGVSSQGPGVSSQVSDRDSDNHWAFSVIPVTQTITGLTYHEGLVWTLNDAVLTRGTTRGVSNRFATGSNPSSDLPCQATLSLEQGIALVIVTPED